MSALISNDDEFTWYSYYIIVLNMVQKEYLTTGYPKCAITICLIKVQDSEEAIELYCLARLGAVIRLLNL